MKETRKQIIVDIIILTVLVNGLLGYIIAEFIIAHYDWTLAPIKTGNMPWLFSSLVAGCLAWCIDKWIFKIKILMGKNKLSAKKENRVVKYLNKIFEKYL
ncbi:MAG: hypothetical protein ACUVQP_09420 [Bacteroidales bacterium]